MAPLLEDPRIRQTWNQFSQNAESATETAAAGIWTFQHTYINPCLSSIGSTFEQCTGRCFPDREERARRARERTRTRGRAELSFDFYDDWDEDIGAEQGGILGGWGNDELDRLLAGSGSHSGGSDVHQAPGRKRGMSYGTRGGRRKSLDKDPTIIPSTSALGFLGRLPFKFGGTLRYKPSAADLQEHPGAHHLDFNEEEGEPLIADDQSDGSRAKRTTRDTRARSSTTSSGDTSDSFRSRGDLFPSDGEDDAVPISDEFAMVLERRPTNSGADDRSSGKTRSSKGKRAVGSKSISRNLSRSTPPSHTRPSSLRLGSGTSLAHTPDLAISDIIETQSLTELQQEEERIRLEEDAEVLRKRQAAIQLAQERGLHKTPQSEEESLSEPKLGPPSIGQVLYPSDHPPVAQGTPDVEDSDVKPLPGDSSGDSHAFVPARLPNFS